MKEDKVDALAIEVNLGEGCCRIRRSPEDPRPRSCSNKGDLRINRISYLVVQKVTCWDTTVIDTDLAMWSYSEGLESKGSFILDDSESSGVRPERFPVLSFFRIRLPCLVSNSGDPEPNGDDRGLGSPVFFLSVS
jgi:hypothetical protein